MAFRRIPLFSLPLLFLFLSPLISTTGSLPYGKATVHSLHPSQPCSMTTCPQTSSRSYGSFALSRVQILVLCYPDPDGLTSSLSPSHSFHLSLYASSLSSRRLNSRDILTAALDASSLDHSTLTIDQRQHPELHPVSVNHFLTLHRAIVEERPRNQIRYSAAISAY